MAQTSHVGLIEKNANLSASNINHDLNKTKDTLLLQSDKLITNVYSINTEYKREVDVYLNKNEFSLPLTELSQGKHVLVVSQSSKKIVFVLHIYDSKNLTSVEKSKLTYSDD
jgi:hypothetical protein